MTKTEELAEIDRRGTEAYERCVAPRLRPEDKGKFVAVDIETGEFELDIDDYEAIERMHQRRPGANLWLMRVGHSTAYRISGMVNERN